MIDESRIRVRINDFIQFADEHINAEWWLEAFLEGRLDEYIEKVRSSPTTAKRR